MTEVDKFPEVLHYLYAGTTAILVALEPVKKGSNKKVDPDVREYEWKYDSKTKACAGCNKSGMRFTVSLKHINHLIACKLIEIGKEDS
jgi:hypothetical protein